MLKLLLNRISRYFLAGVLVVLPVVITVAIVVWVTGFIQGFVGPQTFLGKRLEAVGLQFLTNSSLAYLLGWVIVLAVVFVLGILTESGAKRLLQGCFDLVMARVPLVNSIYNASKQLVEMVDQKDSNELQGMSTVFCRFGDGAGLLALLPTSEKFLLNGKSYYAVLVPTAPVPVGGGLIFMPCECVERVEMSVDGLMSIYVSMGVTAPQFLDVAKSAQANAKRD